MFFVFFIVSCLLRLHAGVCFCFSQFYSSIFMAMMMITTQTLTLCIFAKRSLDIIVAVVIFAHEKKGKKLNEQKQTNKQLNHILSASPFSHLFIYLFLVFHALDYNSIKFLFICYCCDFDVTFSLYLIT